MKKTIAIYIAAALALSQTSCKKFLEEASQDLIRPVTVENYKDLLQGEGYFKDFYKAGWFVDMMTDNLQVLDPGYPTTVENVSAKYARQAYEWAADMEPATGTFTDVLFQHMYKNILAANACILDVAGAQGSEADKAVVLGQAHFHRAYGYFVLANLYAQAYNEASPDDLCVPLILETKPSLKRYNRATVREIWNLISEDIETAVRLLSGDAAARSVYEVNYKAALLLASRVFLYKEEFGKSVEYGEKLLELNSALRNISTVTVVPVPNGATSGGTFLSSPGHPEVLFTFGGMTSATALGGYLYYTRDVVGVADVITGVSGEQAGGLLGTYGPGDKRRSYWFNVPSGTAGAVFGYIGASPLKSSYYDGARTSQYMRNAEAYLNVAEAYARGENPDAAKAVELLNRLRRNRIEGYTDLTTGDFVSPQALSDFIWEERRRELCFDEFHRWWDLRRIGQPALRHTWLNDTYELRAKDPAYILNFPKQELEFNTGLVPNARPQRDPL